MTRQAPPAVRARRWLRSVDDRTPLQVKLIAAMLVLVTVGLAVAGVAAVLFLRRYLLSQVDEQLRNSADGLARLVREGKFAIPGPPPWERHRDPDGERDRPALAVAFYSRIFPTAQGTGPSSTAGERLEAPGGGTAPAPPKLPALGPDAMFRVADRAFTVPATDGGSSWRVLVHPTSSGYTVVVGLSLRQVDDTIADLATAEAVVGIAVLVALAGLGYLAIRSSLRPLMRVEATAEAIAAGDLGRRVPPGHPRTEVGRLAAVLNAMLVQIEAAFRAREASEAAARSAEVVARTSETTALASEARMRRFVADASHELRTPLTSIRGFAELLHRQLTIDPEAVPATTTRIQAAATRMTSLVEDLLLLARLDQQRPLRRQPVDLLGLVTDAVIDFRVTAPGHPVRLETPDDPEAEPPVVDGDEVRLRQVVANLLANVGTHTPPGTKVMVSVATVGGEAVLGVADTGPGLAPEAAERVFERFYRADTSRTRSSGGTGLGLSIVAALVAAHGGTVGVESGPGEGTRFEVRLPLYRPEE